MLCYQGWAREPGHASVSIARQGGGSVYLRGDSPEDLEGDGVRLLDGVDGWVTLMAHLDDTTLMKLCSHTVVSLNNVATMRCECWYCDSCTRSSGKPYLINVLSIKLSPGGYPCWPGEGGSP